MKVFISWSGELSRRLGEILRTWLPGTLQYVKPYFTPEDVEKGARWNTEIAKELNESSIGIFCLTAENLNSSWLMFEAGALSKQIDRSHICPILFGIDNADLKGPLVQFQSTLFHKKDMLKLIHTVNNCCKENRLEKDVRGGRFREDLWFRLNVFPITLPPLRDRKEDIPLIVKFYMDLFTRKLGKQIDSIPAKTMKTLQSYSWPGNVRELQNVIERSVIATPGSKLQLTEAFSEGDQGKPAVFKSLRDMERDYIVSVLDKTGWKVSGKNSAAEILGLDRSTLRAKMKKLDIKK